MRPITRLRRFAAAAACLPDGEWFGAAVEKRLAGDARSLDEELGLTRHGGVPLSRQNRNEKRNALVRDFAARFLTEMPPSERAAALAREFFAFQNRVWPRYADRPTCPADIRGTRRELLFDLCKVGGMPKTIKQLKKLL